MTITNDKGRSKLTFGPADLDAEILPLDGQVQVTLSANDVKFTAVLDAKSAAMLGIYLRDAAQRAARKLNERSRAVREDLAVGKDQA